MNIRLDTLAYTNRLRRIPPLHKMGLALGLLLAVQVMHIPSQLAVLLWMSFWIVGKASIPAKTYLALLGIAALFLVLGLPAVMFEISRENTSTHTGHLLAVHAGSWVVFLNQTGAAKALGILSRSLGSLSCLYFLLLTVPFVDMLHILRRLRIPGIIPELLLLVYRFVFVLLESAQQLRIARTARGGYVGFSNGIRDSGQMIGQLFGRTMNRYQQLWMGLSARGFSGEIKVIPATRHVHDNRFVIQAVVGCIALFAIEWWTGGGQW